MSERVSYQLDQSVATITMDDGKVNVLSPSMLVELNEALDRASSDGAVVVLTGRQGVFSAGFDLAVLNGGGAPAADMLKAGFELSAKLLSFPTPVVIACSGHALAMGSFLLLSADLRIGVAGDRKIGANEVAIGMVMPYTAIEICRQRLSMAYIGRAVINAEIFTPDDAVKAGYLDRVVAADDLAEEAKAAATGLAALNMQAHAYTKKRVRAEALAAIHAAIERDDAEVRALFA